MHTFHQTRATATFLKKSSPFSGPTHFCSSEIVPAENVNETRATATICKKSPPFSGHRHFFLEGVSRRMPFSKLDSGAASPPNLKNKTTVSFTQKLDRFLKMYLAPNRFGLSYRSGSRNATLSKETGPGRHQTLRSPMKMLNAFQRIQP